MTARSGPEERRGPGSEPERWRTAFRDLPCGAVDAGREGEELRLAGWVHRRRDLGGVLFVDLRDRTGLVQLAFGSETAGEVREAADALGPEDVIRVAGRVALRPPEAVNPDMTTGAVELRVTELERVNRAGELPILVAVPPEEALPSEELRLRHRYLDLRRPEMQARLRARHRAVAGARAALDAEGFVEIETPLLTRRTPEGARDYLVPSRVHPGEFFALPQSPQLYKQILMVAGFDRYYQVARCLRDEDLRADRQPEFTQVDVEMSFVDEADVRGVCERMLARMWFEGTGREPETPFPRLTHAEAMERFGTDRPDLRVPWEIGDFTETLTGIGFRIFDGVAAGGGRVRGLVVPDGQPLSRSDLDRLEGVARERGAAGLLWLRRGVEGWSGPVARVVDGEVGHRLETRHGLEPGALLLLVAGPEEVTSPALDGLRRAAARELGTVAEGDAFLWVTDFPLFEPDPETGRPLATHHPFTLPDDTDPAGLAEDPFSVRCRAYDVVCNGHEICSGSLRCHDPALQEAILGVLGIDRREARRRFGFLLEALGRGAPPHGGYALGLDRTVALMVGADSIREVIAFPKTTAARGLMEGAPSPVDAAELAELGLRPGPGTAPDVDAPEAAPGPGAGGVGDGEAADGTPRARGREEATGGEGCA